MKVKVLILDTANSESGDVFEQELEHSYDQGFDIEESYIVSEQKIVFLLTSHRDEK